MSAIRRLSGLAFALTATLYLNAAFAQSNKPPAVSITAPTANAQVPAGSTLTITATATDSDGVSKVEFFYGGTNLIGSDTSSPYQASFVFNTPGTYSLTAKATDTKNAAATSAAVQIQVVAPPITITSPASGTFVQGSTAAVTGTFVGDATATIIVTAGGGHSVLGAISGTSFSANVPLALGRSNDIEVQLARRDGTSALVKRTVTAVEPPVMAFTAPTACRAYRVGDSETFTVDAAIAQGTITEVQFYDNDVPVGAVLTAPPYTRAITFSTLGSHVISARVKDSFNFITSSPGYPLTVATAAPVASIITPTAGQRIATAQAVSLSATATDSDGTVSQLRYVVTTPSGDVTVPGGASATSYQANWMPSAVGTHSVRAIAVDNTGAEGVSTAVQFVVNSPPTVSIASPANNAQFTAPAAFTVSVNAADTDGGSVSKVELYRNSILAGTLTAAPYQFSISGLATGTYQFKAKAYDNDSGVTESSVVAVSVAAPTNQSPTITITSPANNSTITAPATISLAATASDPDGTVAKVEFLDGPSLLATITTPPYAYQWADAPLGAHTIMARVTDNLGAVTNASVSVNVIGTVVAITSPPNGATFNAPGQYEIVANVSTSSGTVTKVEFYDGAQLIGVSADFSYSSATIPFLYQNVAAGTHHHTVRALHSSGQWVQSAAVTTQVATPPSVSLMSPSPNEVVIAPGLLWLSAATAGFSSPIANVRFYSGASLLHTANSAPYTFLWTSVPTGNHVVTAVAQDTSGIEATSPQRLVSVLTAPVLQLTPGIDGSSVANNRVRISGSINSAPNSTVLINGRPAVVADNGAWFAEGVELLPGSNALIVSVKTPGAAPITQTVNITSSAVSPFELIVSPDSGISPLRVTASLVQRAPVSKPVSRVEFDADNDGVADFVTSELPDSTALAVFDYPGESGAMTLTARAYSADNQLLHQESRMIYLQSPDFVAKQALGAYHLLVGRMSEGNSQAALDAFHVNLRALYQRKFQSLGSALTQVAALLGTVTVRAVSSDIAQLTLHRSSAQGELVFTVELLKDVEGIWRIGSM